MEIRDLIACGLSPTAAKRFHPHLAAACARFAINTPARIAAFIAQLRVESGEFSRVEENLWYTTPERIHRVWPSRFSGPAEAAAFCRNPQALANRVYANRIGNGNEASGDGWRFRGRGLKQLTGRSNYAEAAQALGRPYVEQPDLVAQDPDACLTAAFFWHSRKLSELADAWQINEITRRVNGSGMLQAADRLSYSDQAVRELSRLA